MNPEGLLVVIPSRLAVGEPFTLKVKVLGPVRQLPPANGFNTPKPGLNTPFNLNVQRAIAYLDDVLPAWSGSLTVDGGAALDGPSAIRFDGEHQGVFSKDTRPIGSFGGFAWREPGFHFVRLTDPATGVTALSNPVYVSSEAPAERLYWGDPHWQTYFTDGIRCPEELYAFARDEGFLDFGAITDHMEGVTDRQWDYFQLVTNDYNAPGRFVTLIGQEWTHHACGHRNIYVRGNRAPAYRSNDRRHDHLTKLWKALDRLAKPPLVIPHHPANKIMGCDWSLGWNPRYESAIEIYSVWGSSERPATAGNPRPIRHCQGEVPGRHVIDALRAGYRVGFVGGGDIHDGRPGCGMSNRQDRPFAKEVWPQGFTGVWLPELTREALFDGIRQRRTYATSSCRAYLECPVSDGQMQIRLAAEDGLALAELVVNGEVDRCLPLPAEARTLETTLPLPTLGPRDFCYLRLTTANGNLAWSSPEYGAGY